MKTCIYCQQRKGKKEFTLEHLIPQSLGGAFAPDKFKTRDVCSRCNSNLGLFVDASFEKNWFVSQFLREAAYAFFDPANPVGLPLTCMGSSDLVPPDLKEDEVCESWLGPLGEQIFWVRPNDKRLYWYVGGNPITTKKVETRAYFLFSERSEKNLLLSWQSFKDAFEGRRVKKIMCTQLDGANPADIGFSAPDHLDQSRIQYFRDACCTMKTRQNRLSLNMRFDHRFMAKLALGIGYALFGEKSFGTKYFDELQKALWYREGEQPPNIQGSSDLTFDNNQLFKSLVGDKHAVTLVILPSSDGIALNLNLGSSMNWTVKCASYENLDDSDIQPIKDGIAIVLYKYIQRGIKLPLPNFIAHKNGVLKHDELKAISDRIDLHSNYFQNL